MGFTRMLFVSRAIGSAKEHTGAFRLGAQWSDMEDVLVHRYSL